MTASIYARRYGLLQRKALLLFAALAASLFMLVGALAQQSPSLQSSNSPSLGSTFSGSPSGGSLPALTGRVVDDAGIIEPMKRQQLAQKLAAFEAKSSDQVVVVTVPSLQGEDIETYSNRLFRSWALGQKQENNGILLVVAPNDRQVRIEVGYGLEGTMTDALSSLIIHTTIIPAFRNGDYSKGITEGVDGILTVLSGDAAELQARAERYAQAKEDDIDWVAVVFTIFWFLIFFGGLGMAILAPVFGRKIGPGRYEWLGMTINTNSRGSSRSIGGGGWSSGGGGFSGGFSGGGGSSGGGGASGSW